MVQKNNPYKNLNPASLQNCNIAHLKQGEYNLSDEIYVSNNIEFIGENPNNTFMKNVKIINYNQNFYTLSFKNIAVVNAQILNYGILNIENCKFTSNSDDSYLYSEKFSDLDPNSQININNTIFYNITTNRNFINTNCSNVSIFNSYFYNNSVGYNGFVSSINSYLIINNSSFFNNNAFKEGGAIYVSESLMDIDNSLFVNSSASFRGAICNLKSKTDIKNSKFLNNTAVYDDGAIYNMYSTLNLTRTVFNNNGPSGLFLDNSTSNICFSNFTQTDIEVSYKNDFNIDNISIHDEVIHSNISLDGISGVPIYYGNYSIVINLPSCYDGRDYNLNTSVKNQGDGGNCWAFASLATLESCILKANNQSVFDLSEENMKNVIARFSDYGLNMVTNGGGNLNMVSGYLSSWLGSVLDDADVYCPKSTLSPILDISYENNNYAQDYVSFFTFIFNDTNEYNHNYQYDIVLTDWKNNAGNIYYSNNFTSSQNEVLTAVSTYFLTAPINYEISIIINNVLSHNQSGRMDKWGYYTIHLTKQLQLNKNDKFEVIFHLNSSQVYAPFCNDSYITHILYPSNSSRYSLNNVDWVTLDYGVFCIKAFTVLNKTNISIIQLNDTVYTRNNQNQIFFQILDNGGSNVERGKLILNIDNNNYTASVVNGIAEFDNVLLSHTGFFNCNVFYIDDVLYENSNITCSIINKEFLDTNFTLITLIMVKFKK